MMFVVTPHRNKFLHHNTAESDISKNLFQEIEKIFILNNPHLHEEGKFHLVKSIGEVFSKCFATRVADFSILQANIASTLPQDLYKLLSSECEQHGVTIREVRYKGLTYWPEALRILAPLEKLVLIDHKVELIDLLGLQENGHTAHLELQWSEGATETWTYQIHTKLNLNALSAVRTGFYGEQLKIQIFKPHAVDLRIALIPPMANTEGFSDFFNYIESCKTPVHEQGEKLTPGQTIKSLLHVIDSLEGNSIEESLAQQLHAVMALKSPDLLDQLGNLECQRLWSCCAKRSGTLGSGLLNSLMTIFMSDNLVLARSEIKSDTVHKIFLHHLFRLSDTDFFHLMKLPLSDPMIKAHQWLVGVREYAKLFIDGRTLYRNTLKFFGTGSMPPQKPESVIQQFYINQ